MAPTSKANMDPVFEAQLKALRDHYKSSAVAATTGGQITWCTPTRYAWSGDLDDREGIAKAFDRSAASDDASKSVLDPENPGVTGDMLVSAVQSHYLACLERGYRLRHLHGIRAAVHAAARSRAFGDNRGPLVRCGLEYVRDLLARAKKKASA